MPAEKPTPTKASEARRATKPIMEKRRRARINQCLSELKTLILDALNKDPSRHSKLEKADILEMTVRHLQSIQRQQMAAAISTDPTVLSKFRAGFAECANEVSRYITRLDGLEPTLKQRLLNHLSTCINSLSAAAATVGPFSAGGTGLAFPGMGPPHFPGMISSLQSLSVQIPGGLSVPTVGFVPSATGNDNDINNNSTSGTPGSNNGTSQGTNNASSGHNQHAKMFGGLPLIPSRLPNGEFAFLLPTHALASAQSQGQIPESAQRRSSTSSMAETHRDSEHSSWGPPTPTSTATPTSPHPPRTPPFNRRTPSPTSSVSSALSPTGSDSGSELLSSDVTSLRTSASHHSCSVSSSSSEIMDSAADHVPVHRHHHHHHFHQLHGHLEQPSRDENVWRPW